MELEQIHYPFSKVSTPTSSTNNSKGKNILFFLGLTVLFIGGGIYAYNMLSYKMKPNEP
jgi:hypothetical protein